MDSIIIATAHSQNFAKDKDKKIEINLQGGSPYFQYIWIDDELYTLSKTAKRVKIEKTK